jgi:hypothetical protein
VVFAAVVWVLSRLSILSFPAYARALKTRRKSLRLPDFEKDLSFVLLQLINGLKFLQAQGIEDTLASLDHFLLARRDNDPNYRLIITEESYASSSSTTSSAPKMSLCACALAAMLQLFDMADPVGLATRQRSILELPPILASVSIFSTMAVILQKDSPTACLGQVKSMLEYMLWGPSDIIFEPRAAGGGASSGRGGELAESREAGLQRWLDLERATLLQGMVRAQGGLGSLHSVAVYQEYHLLFLVRTCAKMLREASLLFESEVSRM